MHFAPWFWFSAIALAAWGVVAFLQKLSTNYLFAESALIWLAGGLFLLQPWLYPGKPLLGYSTRSLIFALLSGILNWLGTWAMLAAMRNGGKASIVTPFTALYPLVVVVAAPLILRESITLTQGIGIVCALVGGVLLSK